MFNNGFLAFDETAAKTAFLGSELPAGSTFYIGLIYDPSYQKWMWADGSSLGSSYQPWVNGVTPSGASPATCAFVNMNQQWVATDCRNGYYYVCQTPACNSMRYCV